MKSGTLVPLADLSVTSQLFYVCSFFLSSLDAKVNNESLAFFFSQHEQIEQPSSWLWRLSHSRSIRPHLQQLERKRIAGKFLLFRDAPVSGWYLFFSIFLDYE